MTLLLALLAVGQAPLFRVVELDTGRTERVRLADGQSATVKLVAMEETRDSVRLAIRDARVEVEVNGARTTLHCGNYHLPVAIGGVQADCEVTRAYYGDSTEDHWALTRDARLRLWPATSSYMPAGSFVYPLRQRWFATRTQMSNEPTYVDGDERAGSRRIYYHAGLDLGGAEGLVDVLAATSGRVVRVGTALLADEPEKEALGGKYSDTIWVLDERGWYHGYIHLQAFDPAVRLGGRVEMGQKIGTLGKEGASGGWSHLHYEILSRKASGKLGTLDGYAFLWEAYLRQYRPHVVAVARPHRVARVGERVTLDGSRSYSDSRIVEFAWTFTDEGKAAGRTVERTYTRPGTYSEMLRVTDGTGRTDSDFLTVNVLDPEHPEWRPPSIQAAYSPAAGIAPGMPVTFLVRTFGTTAGEEVWDFGDGSGGRTKSDGNVVPRARDGFARLTHIFREAGEYVVRVERANGRGEKAIAHLVVRVGTAVEP